MNQPKPSRPAVPERINGLAAVAANLSWSWNRNARALFRMLDPALWRRTQHNPIELLRRVDSARLAACAADPAFLQLYDAVVAAATQDATSAGTWFATSYPESINRPVAYFSAEFGLHASVPIYSGGLGVLAGDQCKAASDLGVPLVGVGLFYTKGYSDQRLAGGCRGAVRRGRDAARAGARTQGRSLPRDGTTVRPLGEHRRVARHGGAGADSAAGHGPAAERSGRPRAVPSAVRRWARSATAPGMGPGRRGRASAADPGIRPGRLACERRTRRVHAGGARARAGDARDTVRGRRAQGARDEHLHHPHPGARRA